MREIGARLAARADRIKPRHRTRAKSADLREDEPHPMRRLAPGAKLGANLRIDRRLRRNETLQVERIAVQNLGAPKAAACALTASGRNAPVASSSPKRRPSATSK